MDRQNLVSDSCFALSRQCKDLKPFVEKRLEVMNTKIGSLTYLDRIGKAVSAYLPMCPNNESFLYKLVTENLHLFCNLMNMAPAEGQVTDDLQAMGQYEVECKDLMPALAARHNLDQQDYKIAESIRKYTDRGDVYSRLRLLRLAEESIKDDHWLNSIVPRLAYDAHRYNTILEASKDTQQEFYDKIAEGREKAKAITDPKRQEEMLDALNTILTSDRL